MEEERLKKIVNAGGVPTAMFPNSPYRWVRLSDLPKAVAALEGTVEGVEDVYLGRVTDYGHDYLTLAFEGLISSAVKMGDEYKVSPLPVTVAPVTVGEGDV